MCSPAACAAPPTAEQETRRFQGEWRFTSFIVDGTPKPANEWRDYRVFFEGDLWTVYQGEKIAAQSNFTPIPTTMPRQLDIRFRMPEGKTRWIRGIYAFAGDTLTVCDRREERGPRPTRFASPQGSGIYLVAMRRVAR